MGLKKREFPSGKGKFYSVFRDSLVPALSQKYSAQDNPHAKEAYFGGGILLPFKKKVFYLYVTK